MTNIVLFNGPPRSGKDTAAKEMKDLYKRDAEIIKFAAPLKYLTRAFAEFMGDLHGNVLTDIPSVKETANKYLLDLSPREFQIMVSEEWMKPKFGDSVFGTIAARQIKLFPDWQSRIFLISDSGFRSESETLVETFGASNVLLVRLHRRGCDFTLDSRSYIELADLGVTEIDIDNDQTTLHLRHNIAQAIKNWKEAL